MVARAWLRVAALGKITSSASCSCRTAPCALPARASKSSSAATVSTPSSKSLWICRGFIPKPSPKRLSRTSLAISNSCKKSVLWISSCSSGILGGVFWLYSNLDRIGCAILPTMTSTSSNPLALIAELTHRCPLHCVYCSNPLELESRSNELSTELWSRVLEAAAELGVLQADFTGGEPLARPDIVELVRAARSAGLYVNLITSGLPLDEPRLASLVPAGLDHVQLSFQGAREETANEISGTKAHAQKLRVLEWLRQHRVAVTLNFVIHHRNIDQLQEMLALAESSCATRIEFANVQYYGWAFPNRENLLPTRAQLAQSLAFLKREP